MKFADLMAGAEVPRETVEVEIGGKPVKIGLRLLSLVEESDVIVKAREYAVEKGSPDPGSEADPLNEIGLHRATVVLCCMDGEHPEQPFFAPADLDHPSVSRELVAYLFHRHRFLADQHSPRKLEISGDEWAELVASSGGDDPLPFCRLRPGAQWAFVRSMARLLLGSPEGRSLFTAALLARKSPSSSSSAPH